jgi:hypothetical protein
MKPQKTFALLGAIASATAQTGQLGNAGKNLENPAGAAYQATLPKDSPIQGSIIAITNQGQGVDFAVNFENLPTEGGPFRKYHFVHSKLHLLMTPHQLSTFMSLPFLQMAIALAHWATSTLIFAAKLQLAIHLTQKPAKWATLPASTARPTARLSMPALLIPSCRSRLASVHFSAIVLSSCTTQTPHASLAPTSRGSASQP